MFAHTLFVSSTIFIKQQRNYKNTRNEKRQTKHSFGINVRCKFHNSATQQQILNQSTVPIEEIV